MKATIVVVSCIIEHLIDNFVQFEDKTKQKNDKSEILTAVSVNNLHNMYIGIPIWCIVERH